MPWYKRTAVWTVLISMIAMILSQLPPIGTWILSPKVSAEVGSRIGLPNSMGIPGFQVFLDIKNTGNATISVSSLLLDLTYPNGTLKHLSAQSYAKLVSGQSTAIDFPITSIALNVGSNWSELVSFYADFTPSDEEATSKLRLQISQDIISKLAQRGWPAGGLATAAEPLVAEASQFFDKKFDLDKGKYAVSIKCSVNGKEVVLKQANFTLYDYHIAMIKSQKEDYKYGAGIYFPVNQPKHVWALLSK